MPKMVERKCANKRCGAMFQARVADVARGWARFCSKSCQATEQERRTGQHADFLHRTIPQVLGNYEGDGENDSSDPDDFMGHVFESGYFGHGQE